MTRSGSIWVDFGRPKGAFPTVFVVRRPFGRETLDVHETPLAVVYCAGQASPARPQIDRKSLCELPGNACPNRALEKGVPRAPGCSFGTSRALFLVARGSRERPGSAPGMVWSVPGAFLGCPESPRGGPWASWSDLRAPVCDPHSKNHAFRAPICDSHSKNHALGASRTDFRAPVCDPHSKNHAFRAPVCDPHSENHAFRAPDATSGSVARLAVCSFLRLFVRLFVRSFVLSFVRSSVRSGVHALRVCPFVRPFVRSFLRSFVPSLVRSFVRSFVPSFLTSFHPSFLSSFVPSFLPSFLP